MSETSPSISQRRHPYLPGLWLATGFLGLASLAFLLRPLGVTSNTVTESAAKVRLEKLAKLRQEQEKLADSYGWIDKSKGIGHIPISKAMDLIVPELRSAPPRPAYAITTIQPSAISAAGYPLYPELPPVDPNAVAAAVKADGGSTPAPVPATPTKAKKP
jgi:hypothetical protein